MKKPLEEKGFVMTDQARASARVSRSFRIRADAEGDSR